jgi:hypothetical protein
MDPTNSQNYWNTGLFVGYRSGNATIGARYNVLTDKTIFTAVLLCLLFVLF